MNFVAFRMLVGDRAKYLGLLFAIAFSTFLMTNQVSIFAGIMNRTQNQVLDVVDAKIWVTDPETEYIDEIKPMSENDLYAVRGTPGVQWAVRFFKGLPVARAENGKFRQAILLGVDDATLVGAPRQMLMGSMADLRHPDGLVIDRTGYRFFFPDGPIELGRILEMNDHRARIVGVCEAGAPFATFPVIYTRYSNAVRYAGLERNTLSVVLAEPDAGLTAAEVARRIAARTGLRAMTSREFGWSTIQYYLDNTGIPVNFGVTVAIAVIVGTVIVGQTFYLFVSDNIRQFAALKAIGVTNLRIGAMIVQQSLIVSAIGYAFGLALAATFFLAFKEVPKTRGIVLLWPIAAGTAAVIFTIVLAASALSIRRVVRLEPAVVFRN